MGRRKPRSRPGPLELLVEDPEIRKRLLDAVQNGVPLTQASLYAGVGQRSFFRWMARGEAAQARVDDPDDPGPLTADEEMLRQFWVEVRHRRSQVAVRNVALVQKAAQGGYVRREKKRRYKDDSGRWVSETDTEYADVDWRAAKFLLESSFAADFAAAAQRLEVTGADGGPVAIDHGADEIAGLAERLALVASERREEDEQVVDGEIVEDSG